MTGYASVACAKNPTPCISQNIESVELTEQRYREIAATCDNDRLARLYYNRAYHQELLKEGVLFSRLVIQSDGTLQYHMDAYRLYIAMIEIFAQSQYPDLLVRAEILNNVYESRSEVIELRLQGYDRIADTLEKKLLLRNN